MVEELSIFTCTHCGCTNKGHFIAHTDRKRKEEEREREEQEVQDRLEQEENASETNTKIFKKFEEKCSKHNSEWNGWKGKLFPWKIEVKRVNLDFSYQCSETYQIIGRNKIIKEPQKFLFYIEDFSQK